MDFTATATYQQQNNPAYGDMITAMKQQGRQIHEEELANDNLWIEATKVVDEYIKAETTMGYDNKFVGEKPLNSNDSLFKQQESVMDNTAIAKRGLDIMGGFNYNTLSNMDYTSLINKAPRDVAIAFAYLMDTYEKKDITFDGAMRMFKNLSIDPTNYIGFGALSASAKATQTMFTPLKEALISKLTPAKIAMFEGGAYAGGFNLSEQSIKQQAGLQEGINIGELGLNVAGGAGIAGGLVKGGQALGKAFKEGEEALMQQAGGGIPLAPDFYSVAQNAIDSMPNKMSGEAFRNYLAKQGVKQDELNFSGLGDILDKPTITKQEALEALNNPTLKKKVLGDSGEQILKELNQLYMQKDTTIANLAKQNEGVPFYKIENDYFDKTKEGKAITERITQLEAELKKTKGNAKFAQYKTPNIGTNYREVLTTMPDGRLDKLPDNLKAIKADDGYWYVEGAPYDGTNVYASGRSKAEAEAVTLKEMNPQPKFKSSHWAEPNVLYHTRLQDTTIGKDKTLLVEEIQSDWHQKGRSEGYKDKPLTPSEAVEFDKLLEKVRNKDYTAEENKRFLELGQRKKLQEIGIPQAPYAKTWHEKAMKDVIAEAVDKGYDRVAWTVGKTQADRYSLAKQISELKFKKVSDEGYQIYADGQTLGRNVTEKELPNLVGKEMAQKIVKDANREDYKTYSGLDLEVGGEGMKGFYDKILPDFTNKYIKKYGSQLEKKKLSNGDEVWSFPVTEQMKKDIKGKGQALYTIGGATAIGATQNQDEGKK